MPYDVELDHVTKAFDSTIAVNDVSIGIDSGRLTFFLGPSGCGKTTMLRLIGGFEEPTFGKVRIKGKDMTGVPAYRRPTKTVFQEWLLFPHMSVYDNVRYGLRVLKLPESEQRKCVMEALELVGLSGYENRRPHQLSGGEKQRVALSRALVCRPEILLLDEPIGSLDAKMRKQMQIELKNLQEQLGLTFIYVTHDQEEALIMADKIAIVNKGKIEQVGTPREIYDEPKTKFVADFIGETNLLPCRVLKVEAGHLVLSWEGLSVLAPTTEDISQGQDGFVSVRPQNIALKHVERLPNIYTVRIRNRIFHGNGIRFIVEAENRKRLNLVVPRKQDYEDLDIGQETKVGWNTEDSRLVKA